MQLTEMLKEAVEKGASDIFIVSGLPLAYKINNSIQNQSEEKAVSGRDPPDDPGDL